IRYLCKECIRRLAERLTLSSDKEPRVLARALRQRDNLALQIGKRCSSTVLVDYDQASQWPVLWGSEHEGLKRRRFLLHPGELESVEDAELELARTQFVSEFVRRLDQCQLALESGLRLYNRVERLR